MHPRSLAAALAAACIAAPLAASAQSAAAPSISTGQSWTYRAVNDYNRLPLGEVTSQVTGTSDGIRVTVRSGSAEQSARLARPGALAEGPLNDRARGTLSPALDVMPFPLEPGKRWSQTVQRRDAATGDLRDVHVDGRVIGWETVRVPAGEFRALRVERRMRLGDWDQFRGETWRAETEWFVPEVGAPVKLTVFEEYPERRFSMWSFMPGERLTYELTGWKRS
jgi:hypothetical protein